MKKLYFYIFNKQKECYLLCLMCCLIPLVSGLILWNQLPNTMICWETTTASMSGIESRLEVIVIYPIVMTFIEGIIIYLLHNMSQKFISLLGVVIVPVCVMYTSILSLYDGLHHIYIGVLIYCILFLLSVFCISFLGKKKEL